MARGRSSFDMTSGGILKKLLMIAVPIMGTQLLSLVHNFVDMFFLGRIENAAVPGGAIAASGAAGMYMWLSVSLMMVARMGAEIGVAQNIGRGDHENAKKFAQNSFFLAVTLGVAFGAMLVIFCRPLILFFGIEEPAVAVDGAIYLAIIGLGIPASYIGAQLAGMFNAAGNSRIPLVANIIAVVVNIILDPIMIFTFNWGIAGAAIATVVAQYVGAGVAIYAAKFAQNRPFEKLKLFAMPDPAVIKQIFRWSTPVALESATFCFLTMITSRFVGTFGAAAFTTSRIGSQVESFSWLIGGGFGTAVVSFVGQNYGAGKWTRIREGFKISVIAMAAWGTICTIGLYFWGIHLFRLFTNETEVLTLGLTYMHILALCQLPTCLEAVAGSTFKGTGKTLPPAVVSFSCNIARVLLAWLLMNSSLGLNGIWIAVMISAVARGVLSMVWYLVAQRRQPRVDERSADVVAP